jgi:transposase InsO family protein
MRELGLRACQPRAYKRTTVPGEEPVRSPDLIGRDFTAPAPGQKLVGDITYLKTGEGWLYLATVIDLATKMVVGWQLAAHMRTSLITDALDMAIGGGHAPPGAVFHSDRGAQYRSADFARFCQASGIATSTGRTEVCWDNAAAESFFGALKTKCTTGRPSPTGPPPGPPSQTTSRSSTTGNGCTPPWATAPPPKPSPATEPQQPLHDQPRGTVQDR